MDTSYALVSEPLTSSVEIAIPRDVTSDFSMELKAQNAALQSRIEELEAKAQVRTAIYWITSRELSIGCM